MRIRASVVSLIDLPTENGQSVRLTVAFGIIAISKERLA